MALICKKCGKSLPEGALWCCWCGKKQTAETRKARRRSQGMGTIAVNPRNRARWIAITPPAIKGTQGKYLGTFRTRREAEEALEAYLHGHRTDLYNYTLADIYAAWSDKHYDSLTESGIGGYTSAYSDLAELHSRKMRELKTADFQRCLDAVAERFSRSKCEKVKQLCSQLCKYAMQNDIMDKNYAQFLSLPKAEEKEKQIFTPAELASLWKHSPDNRVKFILFMLYTGFRIGEVSELTPDRIHLAEGYIVGGLKTEAGRNRIVPLPPAIPEIAQFVKKWLDNPEKSPFGVSVNSLRQYWFYPALAALGMIDPPTYDPKTRKQVYKNPRLTPHATRHTFASRSAASGMRPEDLKKIIGHSDYATTADIYVHQNLDVLIAAMSHVTK